MHFVKIVVLGASNVGKTSIIQVSQVNIMRKKYLIRFFVWVVYVKKVNIKFAESAYVLVKYFMLKNIFLRNVNILCIFKIKIITTRLLADK